MRRHMLKSKIHRATVTDANVDYVGSVTVDARLLALADIAEHEQVHVLDLDNGARLVTYAIPGGPGELCLNGAAALLVQPGHRVIVLTYADYEDAEIAAHQPVVVHVDRHNRPTQPAAAPQTTGPAPQTTGPAPQTTGPAPQTTGPAPQTTGPAPVAGTAAR